MQHDTMIFRKESGVSRDDLKATVATQRGGDVAPVEQTETAFSMMDSHTEMADFGRSIGDAPKCRDRIVILGRTRAGKTIYLATLYEQLWQGEKGFHLRSVNGQTHMALLGVVETLRTGKWPAATSGLRYLDLEIVYKGKSRPLVSLDYPGEVFRKAFVEGATTPDVVELLDHVDRAAAVVFLVDPKVAEHGSISDAMDDDFGMLMALQRIQSMAAGRPVPVTFVLTKCDLHMDMIRAAGGLTEFIKTRYRQFVRAAPDFFAYTCSAVQTVPGDNGPVVRNDYRPIRVTTPIVYLLDRLAQIDADEAQRKNDRCVRDAQKRAIADDEKAKRRAIVRWTLFWALFLSLAVVLGMIAWRVAGR